MNHGTSSGYTRGCRCDECREAKNEYMRAYADRKRKTNDSTIPMRAMHALDFYRPDWVAEAACRGATDVFFAERGDNVSIRKAKAICAGCPVAEECLRYAVDNNERFGIWGGLGPKERRALKERRAYATVAKCGTDAGYYRHRRTFNEEPCDECRRAHALNQQMYKAKRREAS